MRTPLFRLSPLFASLAMLLTLAACGDDAPVSPVTLPGVDAGFDIGDNNSPSNNNSGDDAGGDDAGGGGDVGGEDVGGEDVGPDAPGCACDAGEVCVTNDTVEAACFPRDCPDQQCDSGEVCSGGQCVSLSCAGVECGGYPNVCRGGSCAVGSCSDPDVSCPGDQICFEDSCYTPCEDQAACGQLACIDERCQPCSISADCGAGLICAGDQCVPSCVDEPGQCGGSEACDPMTGACVVRCTLDASQCTASERCDAESGLCEARCTQDAQCGGGGMICDVESGACVAGCVQAPDRCEGDERCDAESGRCVARCTNDLDCAGDAICDASTGECVPEECAVTGQQDACPSGQLCLERRCVDPSPSIFGSFCGGCEQMRSASYRAFITVGPVEILGGSASSPGYRLESGTLFILSEER